jgi:glucan phosphoethanolaminetransferase (alkaline phosphatase superfamily)
MVVFLALALVELVVLPGMALGGVAKAAFPVGYLAALFVTQPVRKFAGRVRGLWTGIATVLLVVGVFAAIFPVWISSRAQWLTEELAQYGYSPSLPWSGAEGLPTIILFLILIPVYRLGKSHKYAAAAMILAVGWMAFFITSYPFLGRNVQDLVQGGYPRLFARTSTAPSYAAAITFKTYAPLFYGRRPAAMMCNSQPDSCFLQHRMPVPVFKVVPTWAYGSGKHLAGFEEIDHAGPYVLFKKFNSRPGE